MLVVAFGHKKQVGKDTSATFLSSTLRTTVERLNLKKVGFADELKDQCHKLYGWAGLKYRSYYEENPHAKEKVLPIINKSPRQIWIDYGTKVAREVYSNTWVDFIFNGIQAQIVLVTDLRFPNEFDRVKQLGGFCVKINGGYPGQIKSDKDDVVDMQLGNYPDEAWEYIINNNTTKDELYKKIDRLSDVIRSKL